MSHPQHSYPIRAEMQIRNFDRLTNENKTKLIKHNNGLKSVSISLV